MESLTIQRMSTFLPKNVQKKCFRILQDTYKNNRSLANDVGCSLKQLETFREKDIDEKYVSRIFCLGLQHCPEVKDIVKEDVLDEVHRLSSELDIIGENKQKKIEQFLRSLQDKDKAMLLALHGGCYAKLGTLTRLLRTENDTQTLTRIREVINPIAKNILGKPILEFYEKKVHPITGETILFSWWLTEPEMIKSNKEQMDIFDEDKHLRIVMEIPNRDECGVNVETDGTGVVISGKEYYKRIPIYHSIKKLVQKSCKNGILEVILEKEVK